MCVLFVNTKIQDLEKYRNRVKEMRSKNKTLAKYSTDVYQQASQVFFCIIIFPFVKILGFFLCFP